MPISGPDANSAQFKIISSDGVVYDAFLDLSGDSSQGAQKFIDCRYREEGRSDLDYSWLIGPDLGSVSTNAETIASFDACLSIINAKILEEFGGSSTTPEMPTSGIPLVLWLLKNGLRVTNNVISRM